MHPVALVLCTHIGLLFVIMRVRIIDIERPKIDCLSFVMCPLLAQLKIGFFSLFFAAAVYRPNEANKTGLKQSIFLCFESS